MSDTFKCKHTLLNVLNIAHLQYSTWISNFIPYYGLILCDIQVYDQMEINQVSRDQSV